MFVISKLNIFFEMDFFINKSDFLIKMYNSDSICKFKSVQLFLYFDQIFDFNILVYRRILAFCFFMFLVNCFSQNIIKRSNDSYRVIGLKNLLLNKKQIFEFLFNFYILYIRFESNIRRREFAVGNLVVFNIYNLFLFPGFLKYYDDFEELRFCSLRVIVALSCSGIYMRLFLSSLNILLLC